MTAYTLHFILRVETVSIAHFLFIIILRIEFHYNNEFSTLREKHVNNRCYIPHGSTLGLALCDLPLITSYALATQMTLFVAGS